MTSKFDRLVNYDYTSFRRTYMKKKYSLAKFLFAIEIIMIFMASTFVSDAQSFVKFSNQEGFNQNTINTIAQDRYGYLWFGTPNGLIKYDGYEFKTYTSQSKNEGNISSNYISDLFNDSKGVLWIGTHNGVNVYIPSLEKFYTVPLPSKFKISNIRSDNKENIWFTGENQLYQCKLVDVEKGVFEVSENILKKHSNISLINEFSFIGDQNVLLATTTGIRKLDLENDMSTLNPKLKTVVNFENFEEQNISFIKEIKNIFWIGTENGLYQTSIEGNSIQINKKIDNTKTSTATNLPLYANTIFEDENNDIWIGTRNQGLLKYIEKEDEFVTYSYDPKKPLGVSSNIINSIFQDNYNVLWIGTAQGGINKLDISQKQFINYSKNPYDEYAITDNLITSILEDSTGKLWVSTYNKDLFRSQNKITPETVNEIKFKKLKNTFPLLNTNIIRCIYQDKKGYIWFGTDTVIIVYNPFKDVYKRIILKKDGEILPPQVYRNILQIDDNNILLVGRQATVLNNPWSKIETQNIPQIDIKSSLDFGSQYLFYTVLKDYRNSLWFGTNKGIFKGKFDGEKLNILERISDDNSKKLNLSYSEVFSLHDDKAGNIWVGLFGGGLNKIILDTLGNPFKIDFYRKNDVLPDDAIYGILQEHDSLLWMSTDMGLVKFNTKNENVNVFDVRDGLAQNNFRQAAYFKGGSGYFYFGGLNGLTIFKPENIKLNTTPPKILITSLLVNNKEVKIGEKLNNKVILEKSISETRTISINQSEQILAFKLVVEHTSIPKKNKLSYKLEGFNENWIEQETGKTTVTYTNLSAGDYIFKVKAANGDGIWSTDIKTLEVKILPPWYQTWWSYLLFVLSLFLVVAGVFIYFVEHEKLKQRLKYEQLDKERIDTINQGKFRYFTNISHEFRTPLTLIAGPLDHLISINEDIESSKYLAIIQKNTKRLLSLIDQLITFRKAEQGFINLDLSKNTLGNFIYPTTEAFENYAIEKNINFFYKVSSPNEEIIIDIEKVERILFNLLSNSFKNTQPNGNISIEAGIVVDSNKKMIKIDVIDNGKGIPEKDLDNIFDRFYQLGDKDKNISGGGIGLAFCKSLINILEGELSVKSQPNVETRFSITIPFKTELNYLDNEISASEKSFIKDWVPLSNEYKNKSLNYKINSSKKQYSILIVEDEEDVQNFLTSTLSKKYDILIANNGIEGLNMIKLKEPDLIISDVMMPEMDGFAFCEKIKSEPASCHIPILLLSALGENEDMVKGLEFGADDYLSKPFSLKVLELRIKKLIENNIKIKTYFSKNSVLPKKEIEISTRDKEFLNKIIKAIEKNISDSDFGVEELSKEIGLSTSHFYRRLKQLTGQIPNVYLRNFRLQRAAELIKENKGDNVTQIMYQIGIESNSYFSTSFKKLHGVSPSEYSK